LAEWVRDGAAQAGRHLLPEQRSSVDLPVLTSGRVIRVEVASWVSPQRFTLVVGLDLQFGSDPFASNPGANTRFVTVTRDGPDAPFLLAFATSP
jgi:hypothetical protein